MVKIPPEDTYIGVTTTTSLNNEVSTCRIMYYDKYTQVMVNQSVNEFYTRFLFKIDAFPQDVLFTLYIDTIFRELWIS